MLWSSGQARRREPITLRPEARLAGHDQEARGVPARVPTHVSVPSLVVAHSEPDMLVEGFLGRWTALPLHDWRAKLTHFEDHGSTVQVPFVGCHTALTT